MRQVQRWRNRTAAAACRVVVSTTYCTYYTSTAVREGGGGRASGLETGSFAVWEKTLIVSPLAFFVMLMSFLAAAAVSHFV